MPRGLSDPVIDLFVSAFVTLFVVIDPPGCAPIFASLTRGEVAFAPLEIEENSD